MISWEYGSIHTTIHNQLELTPDRDLRGKGQAVFPERNSCARMFDRSLLFCFLFSGILTVAVGFPVIFNGKTFVPTDLLRGRPPWSDKDASDAAVRGRIHLDIVEFFAMNAIQAKRDISEGLGVFWNDAILCGIPLVGDPQVGTFYPPRAIFLRMLPAASSIDAFILFHYFFVMPSMFIFLRGRGLEPGPAIFGALAWALGGQVMGWFKYGCGLVAAVFLPLEAFALDRAWSKRSIYWALGAGGLWGLMFLGGHPQLSFYALVWAGVRAITGIREAGWRWSLRACCAFAMSGAGLAAVQLLPFLAILFQSQKGPFSQVLNFSKPWRTPGLLLMLIWPRAYGSPVDRLDVTWQWLGGNFFEFNAYLGLLSLFLAPLSGRKGAIFWVVGIANLAVATLAPLWCIIRLIPPFYAMVPHRLFLFGFAGAALGSIGLQEALRGSIPRRYLALYLAGTGLIFVVGIGGVLLKARWLSLASEPYAGLFISAASGACALVIISLFPSVKVRYSVVMAALVVDLFPFFVRYNDCHDQMPGPPQVVDSIPRDKRLLVSTPSAYWKSQFRNYVSISGHETPTGHASMYFKRYREFVSALTRPENVDPALVLPSHQRMLWALNVGYVLTHDGLQKFDALPRAWLVGNVEVIGDKDSRLKRLADPGLDLSSVALVERPIPGWSDKKVEGRVERLGRRSFRVRTDVDALLVVSENWDSGWIAELDGAPAEVLRVNHAMRGVLIPAGGHTVRFDYRPVTVKAGFFVTGLTVLAALFWGAWHLVRWLKAA